MATTRQDDKKITRKTTAATSTHAEVFNALQETTRKMHETLARRGSEQLGANQPAAPSYPPVAISESDLQHSTESDAFFKSSLEIKKSSHDIEVVRFNDHGCDLILSSSTDFNDWDQLTSPSNACYVITPGKQIYYLDKNARTATAITVTPEKFEELLEKLSVTTGAVETRKFSTLIENLSSEQLQNITDATAHMHGMSFYKHKDVDSVMSQLEAMNSLVYQLLGPRHFPTCYPVYDESRQYVGVLSKFLSGFKPNRDKPLDEKDLEISSLRNMIKQRDDHELGQIRQIFQTIKDLIPLLKRDADPKQGWLSRALTYTVNTKNYYLGDQYSAQHVKPILEDFTKQNPPTITFGKLEDIRQLLVNRRLTIEQAKSKYIAQQHQHDTELQYINQAIDQLNLILLDEIALFMKHLYHIDKELQKAWADLDSEKNNPSSKHHAIQISEGLIAPLHVSLDDVQHFRIQIGLAIGLLQRYFLLDPDCHAKNIARDGRNVDADLAVYPLTYRFKVPGRKPGANDYALNVNDFTNFPNLVVAIFRYWPAKASILEASADTALSQVSEVTKNSFTKEDNKNFQNLEKSPVFNFQKYIQLIIFSLMDSSMFTACAKLFMNDQVPMLDEDGNVEAPLPLLNSANQRQDLRTTWIEILTLRSQAARHKLAAQLPQVKMILSRHGDFVLELVQDHFKLFMQDRKTELNAEAIALLEEVVNPEKIAASFDTLFKEISPPELAEQERPRSITI